MRAETIAERLRGQAETWRGYLPDDTLWDMSDHQFTESVLMAFGLDDLDMPVHGAFDKLADMFAAVAKAAKVDTDVLREVADQLDYDCSEKATLNSINLVGKAQAKRIREAIGDADYR